MVSNHNNRAKQFQYDSIGIFLICITILLYRGRNECTCMNVCVNIYILYIHCAHCGMVNMYSYSILGA